MNKRAIPTVEQQRDTALPGTPAIAPAGSNLEAIRDSETGILVPPEARAECCIDRHVRVIGAICRESRA